LPRIFVSYRREDGAASAGRLGDRLAREFGGDRVFMDVDSIPLGTDFVKRLADEVQACDALLVVIGPQWIDIRDENGDRRLDDPNDFVRVEIRAALKRNIPVIPILLDGTKIPKANLLPEDIRPLAVRNALDLRHNSFQKDLDRLIKEVGVVFPEAMRASENDGARTIVRPIRWIVGALLVLFGVSIFLFLYRPWVTVAPSPVASSPPQNLRTLAPYPCEAEPKLRAYETRSATTIWFSNAGKTTVRRYWLDQDGKRVRYYPDLAPGQAVEQPTFVTHAWLIADEQDRCIAIYVPEDPAPSAARGSGTASTSH